MNQLCKVCSEPAAGFHFGAFTCEGCKSFFGRTYNNLSQINECKNGGQCVINKQNRTSCKACRLRKCLLVGMSKSGSRYGRRSNWFKIHCALQEQAANMNRGLEGGGGHIPVSLATGHASLPRLSPGTCIDSEEKLGSPALSSPDSNTSDTSVDVEPKRNLSNLAIPQKQISMSDHENAVARELTKITGSALATVGGRGLGPPVPGADFVAGLSLYGIHSGFSLLQASQLYQRLYPPLLYPGLSRPVLESLHHNQQDRTSPTNSPPLQTGRSSSNPPSPSNSLPPPSCQREPISNPSSPQSLPARSFSHHNSPSPDTPSPPLIGRKRPAESAPEQEAPIDLSIKRPRFSPSTPVSLPDLAPIPIPFNFLQLAATSVSAPPSVPVDLTTNA